MRQRWPYLLVGMAVALALYGGVWIGGQRTRGIQYEDCREGNIPNAYLRIRARALKDQRGANLAPRVLPILSCEETLDVGHPVRLRPEEERRYLMIFEGGRLPIVRKGHVTGSGPFPAPRRK